MSAPGKPKFSSDLSESIQAAYDASAIVSLAALACENGCANGLTARTAGTVGLALRRAEVLVDFALDALERLENKEWLAEDEKPLATSEAAA